MSFRHHRRRCRPHQQHHRFGLLLALSSLTSIDRTTAATPRRTARGAQLGRMTKKQPKIRMKIILKLTEYATYACNNELAGNFFVKSNHVYLILAELSIWNLCVVAADGAQLQGGPCDAATAAAGAASNCVLAWLQCNGIMYFLLYIYKISRHGHVSCGLTPSLRLSVLR